MTNWWTSTPVHSSSPATPATPTTLPPLKEEGPLPWAVPKPRSAWLAQATDAGAALEPHTPQGTPQRDHAAIDHDTVALLSEALAALTPGQVSQERQDLAGLRPVGEVRGMPDVSDTRLDAGDEEEGHPMDSVDITPTPAACWQIARPFRAQ